MGRLRTLRWKRVLLFGALGSVIGVIVLVGIGYAMVNVPDKPNASATGTTTRILYADGSEMGRSGTENRVLVGIDDVPLQVQRAVLAAEDRGFYTEPGISPKGIARALFTNVRGGGGVQQGGSSITQQYAKNAFLSSERTYTRKVKEAFIALKLSRTVPKDQILEDYLNTIFFGRQASGIEVASQTYFGVPVQQLTVAQGAVLAASIRSPAKLDPVKYPDDAKARWDYVLDGMVEKGWLSQADRDAQVYPAVLKVGEGPGAKNNDLSGPKGHVITAVLEELGVRGFDKGGAVVTTTVRKPAQDAAVAAVQKVTGALPGAEELQGALVSVEPGTGAVWAYYGGATGTGFDFAGQGGGRQPGSTFKPYVLATALAQGKSLDTKLDGNSPKAFPGVPGGIENFGGSDYGQVDLVTATQKSVNTAYFELGLLVGPSKVADLAHAAGIPQRAPLKGKDGVTNGGIALGGYEVQVIDQAVGYATFANKGVPAEPYFVQKVADASGDTLYEAKPKNGPAAFSPEVAADATVAMQAVVDSGTGMRAKLSGGRPAAGKTGTSTDNKDVWFVGFTPQLATSVWLGYPTGKTIEIAGQEATGGRVATGIWKEQMEVALEGLPVVAFPPRADVGRQARVEPPPQVSQAPRSPRPPPPSARPSVEPSTAPSPEPSAPPSPVPSAVRPSPSPSPSPSPRRPSVAPSVPPIVTSPGG